MNEFIKAVKLALDNECYPYREYELEAYINWFWNKAKKKPPPVWAVVRSFKAKVQRDLDLRNVEHDDDSDF